MQQVHQDFVPLPPIGEGWHSIGGTSICEIHGLVKFNSFNPAQLDCLTFQGHPEFNSDIMNGIVDNLQASYDKCQPEGGHGFNVDEESKLCVERPHDGIMLGRVMLNMFGLQ